jgi:hypothetical protein
MTIVIDHERYGERTEFDALDEAQKTIRACGPEFAGVTLRLSGADVLNEDCEIVGRVIGDKPMLHFKAGRTMITAKDELWHRIEGAGIAEHLPRLRKMLMWMTKAEAEAVLALLDAVTAEEADA